jgi:sugar phosphate isomerase/epimerase
MSDDDRPRPTLPADIGLRVPARSDFGKHATMRRFIGLFVTVVVGLVAQQMWAAEADSAQLRLDNPFFAMDTATGASRLSPDEQAAMLAELGYAGIGVDGAGDIPAMLRALDARELKLFAIYVYVNLGQQPTYSVDLKKTFDKLRGRDVLVWVLVGGKPPDGGKQAVDVIREIGELAADAGLRVALYPHIGCYVEKVEDAVRIARKVDRKNVGLSLNLCHWLKTDSEANMQRIIREAAPYLFVVTINGSDGGDTQSMGWDRLIQTLDRGDFDVYRFLEEVKATGFDGPICFQGFGIGGDVHDNLKRTIDAWKQMSARMEADGK